MEWVWLPRGPGQRLGDPFAGDTAHQVCSDPFADDTARQAVSRGTGAVQKGVMGTGERLVQH